ncbi:MAG: cytochrome-c oxidase, cbb3-type subunit III [Gammaproteobacteria bacterium]|nr:MAG: cytochrome-c oxidase, cbb3-type subunit III [Gammaproteobacteria bacterium]
MSTFWSVFIIVLVVGQVVGALWLLQAFTRAPRAPQADTTGHTWDGDLKEYNNPLPRWWLVLFWLTALWLVVYLLLYPGLGSFQGLRGWSQQNQYAEEVAAAQARYGDVYAAFADLPLAELADNPEAVRLGRNLFLNRCATCHGSDARGARGFPNLTDDAWLWGSAPETIQATITNGRVGVMPALGAALGEQGLNEVVAYLLSLSGRGAADPAAVQAGQQKFLQYCSACHGPQAQGNQMLGAPNLTDDDWLHGSSEEAIRDVILNGRQNQMPAQKDFLTADQIRTLVAYVLSLQQG